MPAFTYADELELKNKSLMAGFTSGKVKKANWPEKVRAYLKENRLKQFKRTINHQQP